MVNAAKPRKTTRKSAKSARTCPDSFVVAWRVLVGLAFTVILVTDSDRQRGRSAGTCEAAIRPACLLGP